MAGKVCPLMSGPGPDHKAKCIGVVCQLWSANEENCALAAVPGLLRQVLDKSGTATITDALRSVENAIRAK